MSARPVMVGSCVVGEVRSRSAVRSFSLADRRILEITALLRHRYGPTLPNGWVGWVRPLLDHAVRRAASEGRPATVAALVERVRLLCPSLAPEDVEPTAAAALAAPGRWTARQLGDQLRLTLDERSALGVRTFRAVGQTAADQRAAKRERDRQRQERLRRDAGATERSVWVANSVEEEARRLGISSRTLRRRKAKEAERPGSVAHNYGNHIGDAPRTPDEAGAPVGARSPAAGLAAIVMRSTGVCPAIVTVEPHEALVVFPPIYSRMGPALADHLGGTLRELGFATTATYDGRSGVHLSIEREAA